MTAKILDGKALALELRAELTHEVAAFRKATSVHPRLVAVLVGDDPASHVYVRNKQRACEKAGIASELIEPGGNATEEQLLEIIAELNHRDDTHGILVQLPLPPQINEQRILDAIDPAKDVDCFHPTNVGLLVQGRPRFLPCTPHGVLQLLHRNNISAQGKSVVIVGRSEIVGKPLANMFIQKDFALGSSAVNATVTLCHSRTENLAEVTKTADILVAAIGKAEFITADMVKKNAVVIDVGINRTDAGLVGDVAFESVSTIASHITPVPGGVGPLTIAMLLRNTLTAAQLPARSASE